MEEDVYDHENDIWSQGSIWQNMPDDIIIHIFSFLDCNSLLEASKTCRKWGRIAADESLWKDLISNKVRLSKTYLPSCLSWYQEFRRLCMHVPTVESEVLTEHVDEVYHVMFSPSGKYFSTTGKDGYVVVWELGMPTKVFTKTEVAALPSYTRYSEFNESETKLLVAGMDMSFYFDGFIKIFQFGTDLFELCHVRVEFPNFRGTWYDDSSFISIARASDETHGHYLKVRIHKAEKNICQHGYRELMRIRHSRHRNDFIRLVDKTKWSTLPKNDEKTCYDDFECSSKRLGQEDMIDGNISTSENNENGHGYDTACSSKRLKQENVDDETEHQFYFKNDKSIVLSQTSINYKSAIYQYNIESDTVEMEEEEEENEGKDIFTCPLTVYEGDCTVIGTNLSADHRNLAYAIRQKIPGIRHSLYNESIEVKVHDLQNDCDTEEIYIGAKAIGEDHVSYIFPSISEDYIACGSENLKGYLWHRKYGVLLSELNHECGVHSQNGVNGTAFCPTNQEILVTVADDLNVRVWRSRQCILDSKVQSKILLKNESKEKGRCIMPPSTGSIIQDTNLSRYLENSAPDECDELEDSKVTCCYGIKHRKSNRKKEKKNPTENLSVVNVDF